MGLICRAVQEICSVLAFQHSEINILRFLKEKPRKWKHYTQLYCEFQQEKQNTEWEVNIITFSLLSSQTISTMQKNLEKGLFSTHMDQLRVKYTARSAYGQYNG